MCSSSLFAEGRERLVARVGATSQRINILIQINSSGAQPRDQDKHTGLSCCVWKGSLCVNLTLQDNAECH